MTTTTEYSDKDSNSEFEEEEEPEELEDDDGDDDGDDGDNDGDNDGDDDGDDGDDDVEDGDNDEDDGDDDGEEKNNDDAEENSDDDRIRSDSSQEIESEGHDEDLKPEKSERTLTSDTHGAEDNDGRCHSLDLLNNLLAIQGTGAQPEKEAPIEVCESVEKHREEPSGNEAHSNNSLDNNKSLSSNEKKVAADTLVRNDFGDKVSNTVLCSEDVKLRAPRLITPQIRPRSLSSGAEFEDQNKKPAILCDFFAKGWCIKGSSCRFLHKKDGVVNTNNLAKVDDETVERSSAAQWKSFPGEEYNLFSRDPLLHSNLNPHADQMEIKRSGSQELVRGYSLVQNILDYRFFPRGSVLSSITYGNHTSLPRSSSSPFYSRLESDNFPLHSVPVDPVVSLGHKTKTTAYDWEPSVPFRPTFRLPSNFLSSLRNLYDPLLDSIELPNARDRSLQSSSLSQGAIVQSASHILGDSVDQRPQSGISEKSSHTHGVAEDKTSAEATGDCVARKRDKSSMPKAEKPLQPGPVVNASNVDEMGFSHNLGVDGVKDWKESKTFKLFRASLVNFVKELVKPFWCEGQLSKVAHNAIVKKAVEKVLSTLQPHQIPSTQESTDQYLSSSRAKLAKLVQGYVVKYGKS